MKAALTLLAMVLCLGATQTRAEKLVTGVSTDAVSITSSFDGEALTMFGSIEPETGSTDKFVTGPYQVIVVVTGPLENRVARLKQQASGLWMNTREVVFRGFPSYYHVLSSDRLDDITAPGTLLDKAIRPEDLAQRAAAPNSVGVALFGKELVRLMTQSGQIGVNEQGVTFRSDTFYSAQLQLPSDIPNGPFIAHTYLFKNGNLIAEKADGFTVRTTGFERFLAIAAAQYPLPYGLTCVVLALFTGWLGGVVFRR